jgi:transposase
MTVPTDDAKRNQLARRGALHPHPERVTDALFQEGSFFDTCDAVQVKYEMLRRVQEDQLSVTEAARRFGCSRTAFYQALSHFQQQGIPGLIPKRPGPKGAHKLKGVVLEFIQQQQQDSDEVLRPEMLAKLIGSKFGISVHPRSIERALSKGRKKGP